MPSSTNDALLSAALSAADQPPPMPPPPLHTSPTLAGLAPPRRPSRTTACEACPNSVWLATPADLKCYCRVMYLISWHSTEPQQITACDGVFQ